MQAVPANCTPRTHVATFGAIRNEGYPGSATQLRRSAAYLSARHTKYMYCRTWLPNPNEPSQPRVANATDDPDAPESSRKGSFLTVACFAMEAGVTLGSCITLGEVNDRTCRAACKCDYDDENMVV